MIFLQKRATAGTNLTALWGFDTRDYSHPSALGDFVGTLSPFDLNSSPFGGDTNYVTGSYAGTATDWGAILGAVNTEDFAPVLVMAWSDRVSGDADYVQAAMTARQTNGGSPDPSYLGLITMTPSGSTRIRPPRRLASRSCGLTAKPEPQGCTSTGTWAPTTTAPCLTAHGWMIGALRPTRHRLIPLGAELALTRSCPLRTRRHQRRQTNSGT